MAPSTFREPARMADERPLNLVQLGANYFDTGTLNKTSGCINDFVAHSILTTAA
ncbi:hypothetical protein [Lactiplantibacillus plantarum]|uniref:hypothetical protein n=1 Tax=Lactiplantibacillus plantarum TaxID=1590 RepID=UPI00141A9922|nr:hypothetical protein [Lactiplantibacillus plantarum]MCK6240892.1 hypothetical protein [Lactiplantibacillus plantarum]MDO1573325.1 hypothetical protein [Lactiplantibacillus plantarum]QTL11726.1 hypothetical protein J7V10_15060 [Lactiplantibacillus plantarum]QVG77222.1 hypothetical protein G9282_05375 [Lactiplantibacillus plantarum]WHQ49502.1 hypothetical protein M1853_04775 [Lactiplantibacillus plantarum]